MKYLAILLVLMITLSTAIWVPPARGQQDNPTPEPGTPQEVIPFLVQEGYLASAEGVLTAEVNQIVVDMAYQNDMINWQMLDGNYTDFVMGAVIEWGDDMAGDACGFAFRFRNNQNLYVIEIGYEGDLLFDENTAAGWQDVVWGNGTNIRIGQGEQNILVVAAVGETFSAFVNGKFAGAFEDDTLARGEVGPTGEAHGGGAAGSRCTFNDVWVWDLTSNPAMTPVSPAAQTQPLQPGDAAPPEDGVTVPVFCNVLDTPPEPIPEGESVYLVFGWMTYTEQQVRDYLNSAVMEATLDGQPVQVDWDRYATPIAQGGNSPFDYEIDWYIPVGSLAPGDHYVTYRVTYTRKIFDGEYYYGPGTSTLEQSWDCDFTVSPAAPTPTPTTVPVQPFAENVIELYTRDDGQIGIKPLAGEYDLGGWVVGVGTELSVDAQTLDSLEFPAGLGIVIGAGGITLRGVDYPEGTRLLVSEDGTLTPINLDLASLIHAPTVTGRVAENADLRKGPSTFFGVITQVTPDDTLEILGRNEAGSWLRVRLADGTEGWIDADSIVTDATINTLPVWKP